MSEQLNRSTTSPGNPPRRAVVVVGIVVVLIVALVAVLFTIDTGDGFGLVDSDSVALSYLSIFPLVAGDAVIPIFPGETTLNAASTLAAQGSLSLPLVIVAGALGASRILRPPGTWSSSTTRRGGRSPAARAELSVRAPLAHDSARRLHRRPPRRPARA